MSEALIAPRRELASLREFLEGPTIVGRLAKVLPDNLKPERLIRQTLTLAAREPKILQCSQISILTALVQAAELHLELAGPLGQAYLVPRWNSKNRCNEATFQVGYRGLITLAYRSEKVTSFQIRTVYEKDEFDIELGVHPRIHHKPFLDGDPGVGRCYYCVSHLVKEGYELEVMSRCQIDAHRDRYAKGYEKDYSPWQSAYDAMAGKTVAKRLAKRLPLSVQFATAAELDDSHERGEFSTPLRAGARTEELAGRLAGNDALDALPDLAGEEAEELAKP